MKSRFGKYLRLSLRVKAILAFITLGLILLGTFVFLSAKRYHAMMEEEMKNKYLWLGKTLTAGLAPALLTNNTAQVENLLDQTIQDEDALYLIVRDQQGSILAAKRKPAPRPYDLNSRPFQPEMQEEFREIGTLPKDPFHKEGHILEIVKPINSDSVTIGWLQLGLDTVRLNKAVAHATYWGIRLLVLFFAVGAILVALIDRKMKRTISRLIRTTQQMAEGDFFQRVEIRTGDALEELGNSYNRMEQALRDRDAQIMKHQEELESKVSERTQQLHAEKTKLNAILDHVPSGFLLLDENLRLEMASSNFEKITGRKVSELIGKCCTLSLWNDQLCETCTAERCLKTRTPITEVIRIMRGPGEYTYFEHSAIPIKRNGRIKYVLEIITDITQRQLLQERMIRTEKLAATGEMAAVIAHEMRNSLTSVNMILQLLMEKAEDKNLDNESIQVALSSIKRSESIVNQLLQFSRPKTLQRHSSDLNRIVQDTVAMTQHQFRRRGTEVTLQLEPNLPLLQVDAEMIKEALVNLLLNAEQAVDGAGCVKVTTGLCTLRSMLSDLTSPIAANHLTSNNDEVGHVHEITIRKGTNIAYVEVSDNGCGIAAEHHERVFDPFFTTKINGTGLGLPLVKRIVNEHGGVVKVESKIAKGSLFTVILPIID